MSSILKCTVMLSCMFIFVTAMMAQTEIATVEELVAIGANKNSMEESYILINDIIVDNWNPIGGDTEDSFNGIFDGNGHTITINSFHSELDNSHVGLFCVIGEKGIVKNLRVAGKVNYTGGRKFLYIGGFAGVNSGMITCCVSSIDLNCDYVKKETEKKVKSLFGYEMGQYGGCITGVNVGTIIHCYSIGSIKIQGQAAGIAACNGKPIKGSIGLSVGSGGVGVSASPGAMPLVKGGIAYCYSSATVSSTSYTTKLLVVGGASGLVTTNHLETATLYHCVALNPLIEAKGKIPPKATPFPIGPAAAMGLSHINTQFYYREDIITHRYNDQNVEQKPTKISSKCAVNLASTQEESWWRMPEGLTKKEQQKVLGFPFGEDETSPWQWSDKLKRPILYWETDSFQ